MKREDWLKTLESDEMTETYKKEHGIEIERAKQELIDDIPTGNVAIAHGVFGPETEDSDAYVNVIPITPPEGGTFTKVYGCSYMLKGSYPGFLVKGMQLPKFFFSGFLKDVVGESWLISGALFIRFLFRRKKFLERTAWLLRGFDERVAQNYEITPPECYNDLEKEIGRAIIKATEGEGVWGEIVRLFVRFLKIVLFMDNGYKFVAQDGLQNVDRELAQKDGLKEFWRIYNLILSRETDLGMRRKFRFIGRGLKFLLLTSPTLKRIISKFMNELNPEKLKMDESDHYFSLRFKSYNIGGRIFEDREAEWHRINKEKGHVFMI